MRNMVCYATRVNQDVARAIMRKGTRLNLRCKRCGRAFKNAGALNAHTTRHREGDALNKRRGVPVR